VLAVLSITAPIFILIGLGFFSARSGLVNREQVRGMGGFVITFALPALVIKALAERPLGEVLNVPFLVAYALGSLAMFAAGFALSRWVRKRDVSSSAITALGMSVSNSGFIGYPIVAMVLGAPAAVALALGMLVENLLMIPLALVLAEVGRQRGQAGLTVLGETLKRLCKNPVIIAICIGLLLSLLEVRLPVLLSRVIEMLASASAPVALFVIGGTLYGLKSQGMWREVGEISLAKLLLHPLAVFAAFALVPDVEPQLLVAGVLFASAPMMSIYPILGQRFGLEERCAAALVAATVLAFITVSALVGFLGYSGALG
tara:strand:- start:4357 stop:5304 length:948 start_codon:yes stop_codon:yes gene_type:complete